MDDINVVYVLLPYFLNGIVNSLHNCRVLTVLYSFEQVDDLLSGCQFLREQIVTLRYGFV